MAQTFRPYPESGQEATGAFILGHFLVETITRAPLHFMALVPHVLIPIYGVYRVMKSSGYWTPQVDYAVETIIVPLLQGLSLGGFLGAAILRWGTSTGRKIAHKRQEDAATDAEAKSQHRLDMILYSFMYLGFATIVWQQLPAAHGPGIAALKKLANRVGVDVGEKWKTRTYSYN